MIKMDLPFSEKAVFYALNDNPKYIFFAKNSIESIRKFNKDIPVYVFIFGKRFKDFRFFEEQKVKIIQKNSVPENYLTSLKWLALNELKDNTEEKMVFLDADTICFEDIDKIFKIYSELDFYAREEVTKVNNKTQYIIDGKPVKPPILYQDVYNSLLVKFQLKPVPVYNTGVMVFNNFSYKKIVPELNFYMWLLNKFIMKKEPFPCSNFYLVEEVVSSMVFGKIDNLTFGIMDTKDSPWYIEHKLGLSEGKGIVMHIWSFFYEKYLEEVRGK